jgi:hypothetical protein
MEGLFRGLRITHPEAGKPGEPSTFPSPGLKPASPFFSFRCAEKRLLKAADHPRSAKYKRARPKANSYVQPSIFDMLAGESPASARDGWAE